MIAPAVVSKGSQSKVNIDGGLNDTLSKWLETSEAIKLGYHSKAQFVTEAVREYLTNLQRTEEKFMHLYWPNEKDERLTIDVDIYNTKAICNICKSDKCIHIQTLYTDKYIQKQLRKREIKLPLIKEESNP